MTRLASLPFFRTRRALVAAVDKLRQQREEIHNLRRQIDIERGRLAKEKHKGERLRRRLQHLRADRSARRAQAAPLVPPGRGILVFDHIPKTGGTTFRRSYLPAALPREQRWIVAGGATNAQDLQRLLSMSQAERRSLRVVAGHGVEALRAHWPDARFVTVVRDPVERAISSYLHAMFHPDDDSLWEAVRRDKPSLAAFVRQYQPSDEQSRQLLGQDYQTLTDDEIRARLNARYAIVGYTEALEQFVFVLHASEGLPLCLFNNRLVRTERRTYVPDPAELDAVRRHNAVDARLHAIVRDEFQARVNVLPASGRSGMQRYLEALETFRAETNGDVGRAVRLEETHEYGGPAR